MFGELVPVLFRGHSGSFDDVGDLFCLLATECVEFRTGAADEIEAQAFQLLAELRIFD